MQGVLRALVVAAASVAAGSWVGLARPMEAAVRVAPAAPRSPEPRPLPPRLPPLPQEIDPSLVRSLDPWPRLNPEASIAQAWRIAEGPHKRRPDARRLVTLTFDDGPSPETTPAVLKLLARYRVRATFFVIGRYLEGDSPRAALSRKILARTAAAGHLVGNHTHDHARLAAIPRAQAIEQIDRGSAAIERVLRKKPILFRPPFGELDDFGEDAVRARGLDLLLWSAEVQDMERDDVQQMVRELVAQIDYKDGGVVLLHDVRKTSVAVLEKLLARLDRRRWDPEQPDRWGYVLVDLPTYLREVEESPQPPREELSRR